MTRLVGFVFLVISSITNLYANLPSGSPVVAQSGVSVLIENIKPTNRIISFEPETGSFPLASVQATHATTVSEVYHFTTPAGTVVAGPNQPFFDLVRKQFVPAYAWTTEHVFVDQQLRPVQTLGINCVQGSQQCYELYLQPHHIFFVSDARVMAHNNPLAIYTAIRCASIVAQALPEMIAGFMAVQKLYDAGRAKFLGSPAVAAPLPPPASVVPVSVSSIAPVTQAQSALLPQKIISAAVKKTVTKPKLTVMPSTSSIVHIPIKYVVKDAQALGAVQAVEKVVTASSAGTQVASAVVPPVYTLKEALMQAALPVALAGAAIAYGLHCQDARDQSMAVCERQQEIVRYAGVSAEGHVQRVTKEALLAGLIVDSNHYFGRFDAYRFSEYLEFLKTDGEYERYIQILRDLLEKKADSLSDQEYALVSQVPGIKKPDGWLGTVKKWFTPLRSCAQILDDHYAAKNGYDFSYQGQTVSLTQLIKILAHEVDNKQLKKLEQNLAAFFDKYEPTSEWKELFDLVSQPNECVSDLDQPLDGVGEGQDAPAMQDTPACGAAVDLAITLPGKIDCNGNFVNQESPQPPCNGNNDDAESSPCNWDAGQHVAPMDDGNEEAQAKSNISENGNEDKEQDVIVKANEDPISKDDLGRLINERGKAFENFLLENLDGRGSFKVTSKIHGTREFDGAVGGVWYEAKSGKYWDMILQDKKKLAKFGDDMLRGQRIAHENGATYELHSQSSIPDDIKKWLTKNKITFHEWK